MLDEPFKEACLYHNSTRHNSKRHAIRRHSV